MYGLEQRTLLAVFKKFVLIKEENENMLERTHKAVN